MVPFFYIKKKQKGFINSVKTWKKIQAPTPFNRLNLKFLVKPRANATAFKGSKKPKIEKN